MHFVANCNAREGEQIHSVWWLSGSATSCRIASEFGCHAVSQLSDDNVGVESCFRLLLSRLGESSSPSSLRQPLLSTAQYQTLEQRVHICLQVAVDTYMKLHAGRPEHARLFSFSWSKNQTRYQQAAFLQRVNNSDCSVYEKIGALLAVRQAIRKESIVYNGSKLLRGIQHAVTQIEQMTHLYIGNEDYGGYLHSIGVKVSDKSSGKGLLLDEDALGWASTSVISLARRQTMRMQSRAAR